MSQMVGDLGDDFDDLLEQAKSEASGQWEENFCDEMRAKYQEYGERMYISDKQLEILHRIAKDE